MENKGFNWLKLAIQVLVIFVFVLILVWIFPMPGKNKSYNLDNYNENFEILRTTARNYYTTDRLPSNIGESKTMTLQEMIDKKIIRELTDENGKACDASKSYVKVTKNNAQEYELKIELTCGDNTDYVYDTIGCYDVCTGNDCKNTANNTNAPTNTVNKPSTGNSTTTTTAKTLLQYRYKKVDIQKTVEYSCPNGYTRQGDKCYKTIAGSTIAATAKYKEGSIIYKDPVAKTGKSKTLYQDPVATKGADKKVSLNVIKTTRTVDNSWSYGATASQYYSDWAYSKTINTTKSQSSTNTTKYELTGSKSEYVCPSVSNCPGIVITYTYRVYTRQLLTKYSCPNGGSLSGTTCYVSDKKTVTDYSCPSDATIKEGSGSSLKCYKMVPGETTYSCADKSYTYDKNANKCYKVVPGETTYYCADSDYTYDQAKNKCYKVTDKEIIGYECPKGYTLNGKLCVTSSKTETIDATKKNKCIVTTIYTWNSKTTLEGWEKTGETRTITL